MICNTSIKGESMSIWKQTWEYYDIQRRASLERDKQRGEVSATTVIMTAALIALAIAVGATISGRVRDKANTINLG
jgi:Na+/glutamate symporter